MDLFIVVMAVLFVHVWGDDNPLHKDEWMTDWASFIRTNISSSPSVQFILSVALPALAAAVILWLVVSISYWLILPISVAILLYSFGRNEFSSIVQEYTQACSDADWAAGIERAESLGVDTQGLVEGDWDSLHQYVFDEAAYRGFERMFAVLFWFFLAGPIGALVYRLIFLFNHMPITTEASSTVPAKNLEAQKWLWLMEWPAVRLLGLSFAMTGNFVGCYNRWRESVMCFKRPTQMTIGRSVLGALAVDDDLGHNCEVTRNELSLLEKLYRRTLWFWLAASAIFVIVS